MSPNSRPEELHTETIAHPEDPKDAANEVAASSNVAKLGAGLGTTSTTPSEDSSNVVTGNISNDGQGDNARAESGLEQGLGGLRISESTEHNVKEVKDATQPKTATDRLHSPSPPPPPPKDAKYTSTSTVQDEEKAAEAEREKGAVDDAIVVQPTVDDLQDGSKPEIRGIMTQFEGSTDVGLAETPTTTPSSLPVFQYPPRSSSLGPPPTSQRSVSVHEPAPPSLVGASQTPSLSRASSMVLAPPLPEPEPEPDLPFDFHRFLEQLRHRTADPVAKFLRSFLQEFGKKPWMVHEQQKIIGDFLAFIANRMAQCEVWISVSEAEFDNAKEGMEKLVMNRLYSQTFSPEIPPPELPGKRRKGSTAPIGPVRRGQHQEDVERDGVLAQKVRIYGWIREEHLDLKPFSDKGRKFLVLAQQELSKMKSYRAPRDKVICILNCCKVLFGFLRNNHADQSADSFIPLLIYTVLKANPDHLVSNVQYILRFRNPDKLNGEAGYYMSSLLGAVQFIENLDKTNLTITDEEFEKNVEAAVSAIAEREAQQERKASIKQDSRQASSQEPSTKPPPTELPKPSPQPGSDETEDNAAVAGLLRTIQKPLSTIGRIFSDEGPVTSALKPTGPAATPQLTPRPSEVGSLPTQAQVQSSDLAPGALAAQRRKLEATDAAARQASAETAEAHRISQTEHQTVVETLAGMFPDLDRDIISDVVRMKEGRVGLAVDACLALSR